VGENGGSWRIIDTKGGAKGVLHRLVVINMLRALVLFPIAGGREVPERSGIRRWGRKRVFSSFIGNNLSKMGTGGDRPCRKRGGVWGFIGKYWLRSGEKRRENMPNGELNSLPIEQKRKKEALLGLPMQWMCNLVGIAAWQGIIWLGLRCRREISKVAGPCPTVGRENKEGLTV